MFELDLLEEKGRCIGFILNVQKISASKVIWSMPLIVS